MVGVEKLSKGRGKGRPAKSGTNAMKRGSEFHSLVEHYVNHRPLGSCKCKAKGSRNIELITKAGETISRFSDMGYDQMVCEHRLEEEEEEEEGNQKTDGSTIRTRADLIMRNSSSKKIAIVELKTGTHRSNHAIQKSHLLQLYGTMDLWNQKHPGAKVDELYLAYPDMNSLISVSRLEWGGLKLMWEDVVRKGLLI